MRLRICFNCGRRVSLLFAVVLAVQTSEAVVVRGTVTDPLGRPAAGAYVRLIQGRKSIGIDTAARDGSYTIRSPASGRFVLLTTSASFAPQVGQDFYGGRTAVIVRHISLDRAAIQAVTTPIVSGITIAPEQLSSRVSRISADDLRTRIGLDDDLALAPGLALALKGQIGGLASLLVRGGDASKVTVDGVSVGGRFDLGGVSSTALDTSEIYRGANSALYGLDAQSGVVALATKRGSSLKPLFEYSGDAGNLNTWRDEAVLSGTHTRLDYLAGYSHVDTSNALDLDRYHASTAAANLGYSVLTNTVARFTLRNGVTASGAPGPHDIFGISANGRRANQYLYSGLSIDNRVGRSHTVVRYGIARKREQTFDYLPVGLRVVSSGVTTYYGTTVTLRGANGAQVTGQAAMSYTGIYPAREDDAADRDELTLQTDYEFTRHFTALAGFRYEDERGETVNVSVGQNAKLKRKSFAGNLQLQGDIADRVFYSAGGSIENNALVGLQSSPRVGVAYVPVRPAARWMRGTKIYGNAATGFGEPSLRDTVNSLYTTLKLARNAAAIGLYGIAPLTGPRSRTFEMGVDQNIRGQKVIFRATYFHNQFAHQIDVLDPGTQRALFGTPMRPLEADAVDDSLAYRAQGIETELRYQPKSRIFLHGGYTYLLSVVERSFAAGGAIDPNFPGVAIGSSYPLIGARPFQRPPHSGFLAVQYTGTKLTAAIHGTIASRADDTTYQAGNDLNGGNTLLLPNRDLDFSYAKLDSDLTLMVSRHITAFTQLDNLLNQQHIGQIGYPGLPFTVRAGFKIRLGGD